MCGARSLPVYLGVELRLELLERLNARCLKALRRNVEADLAVLPVVSAMLIGPLKNHFRGSGLCLSLRYFQGVSGIAKTGTQSIGLFSEGGGVVDERGDFRFRPLKRSGKTDGSSGRSRHDDWGAGLLRQFAKLGVLDRQRSADRSVIEFPVARSKIGLPFDSSVAARER